MTSAELIAVASAEVGYLEKASNSRLDEPTANPGKGNWTKYARDLAQAGYYNGNKNGYAWCNVFVDWCFYIASGKNKELAQNISCQSGKLGAVCTYSALYYKNVGRFGSAPTPGAQIYFKGDTGYAHTGIVESSDDKYVYTIEGNASNSVCRKKYSLTNKTIAGYGYPCYSDDESCAEKAESSAPTKREDSTIVTVNTFVLRVGSRGNTVQTLQVLLNYWGEADLDVDGSFGTLTEQAVLRFQREKSLEVDGIVGKQTWTALLN